MALATKQAHLFCGRVRGRRGGRSGDGDKEALKEHQEMATPIEIGQAGERIVVQWLRNYRFTIQGWDTQSPGSTDIEAESSKAHILVQVKSAADPNEPPSLSSDEERNIKSRATRIGAEAWEAQVQLNASLQLVGEIQWRKLS